MEWERGDGGSQAAYAVILSLVTVICHLRILGRVQGVGFRMYMQREAQRHGVAVWVCNRRDGSVEAIVQGSREAVDALIEWARCGPPSARVTDVQISPESGSYSDFEMRPTE